MPNINKIKLSGTSYDIQDANATKTVELTQAQYDALVTGGTVDSNTFYIITDGEMFNPSGKVDTSAFTEFSGAVETELSGKTDESAFTAHTGDSTIHVTTAQTAAWNAKSDFSGSYNDLTNKLSAGTNITIVDNVISAEGGGGKAITAGRGIEITTGTTADTVSFNLPISASTGTGSLIIGSSTTASGNNSFAGGDDAIASGNWSFAFGRGKATNNYAFAANGGSKATKGYSAAFNTSEANNTYAFSCGTSKSNGYASFASGWDNKSLNNYESSFGYYNVSSSASTTFGDSGNTLFSVGNGTGTNARHNAFEIRQNGDIYCSDGTNDVKLQDTITATSANTTALGGLKLVKLSQSEYDALATKDSNTLYVING